MNPNETENTQPSPASLIEIPEAKPMLPSPAWYKNKTTIIAILLGIVILGGAGGYYLYNTKFNKGPVVAVVSGKNIYQKELSESIALIEKAALAQQADITNPDIQKMIQDQALEVLVNNTLLLTAASEANIEVSTEEIEEKYNELVTEVGGAEELAAKMAEVELTEEKLRSNIKERLIADKYIESAVQLSTLTVTDEEARALYDGLASGAGEEEIPTFDEVKEQMRADLIMQKQQQAIADLLQKLRDENGVEVKI